MPNTDYLASLQQFMSQRFPQPDPLWNYSADNSLPADWLVATPTDVWGQNYAAFKQAKAGADPDFQLATCAGSIGPTDQCVALGATVTKPGDAPRSLLVDHSYRIYEALYEVMISAEICLDFTTLTQPTGRFLDAFRNAVTYISNKPAAKRPVIRILYSNPPPDLYGTVRPPTAAAFLADLTAHLDDLQHLRIYVTVMSAGLVSWNHAKIVAADGKLALVGGHNVWGDHYLGVDPVFDVSMKLQGSAARHAHDFANGLWDYEIWRSKHPVWNLQKRLPRQQDLHASYDLDPLSQRCKIVSPALPPDGLYAQLAAQFPTSPAAGSSKTLAVGRSGNSRSSYLLPEAYRRMFPFAEPSDEAMCNLISMSTSSVRMSLQALSQVPYQLPGLGFNWPFLTELVKAMQRGVTVQIVLSNPGAIAGGLSGSKAPYDGGTLDWANATMLWLMTKHMGLSDAIARQLLANKLQIASLRYSGEGQYPSGRQISNHAKTFIVDDKVLYVGSQNAYLCNLAEFGYMVEDAAAAQYYLDNYWTPLWKWSSATVTQAIDDDFGARQAAEAIHFILDMKQNTRVAMIWARLNAQADAATDATEKSFIETGINDLILDSGFATDLQSVREQLAAPFFAGPQPAAVATTEALRFVINLMQSPPLARAFAKVLDAQVSSVDEANGNIDKFLASQKYDCSAIQAFAAFIEMRRKVLVYWSGNYTTWLTPDGGGAYDFSAPATPGNAGPKRAVGDIAVENGPTLVITGAGDVLLDGVKIDSPSYNNNCLSWTAGSNGAGNATAATLNFGVVTRDGLDSPFHGIECFGTVTYPDDGVAPRQGVCSLYAQVALAPAGTPDVTDKQSFTVAYVLGGLAVAAAFGIGGHILWKRSAAAYENTRAGVEKRAVDLADMARAGETSNDLVPLQSRGQTVERGGLRRRIAVDTVEELRGGERTLVRFGSGMTAAERASLSAAARSLDKAEAALADPPADTMDALAAGALNDARAAQVTFDALASSVAALTPQSRAQISDASAATDENERLMDSYDDDFDNGELIGD